MQFPALGSSVVCGQRADASIEPETEEIQAELIRMLASEEFKVPDRLRRFMIYVVMQTLGGHAKNINAHSIAVDVFGRPVSFDQKNDPIVRVEAGRLRHAIERYYYAAGRSDPIIIEIPKGGYVPRFSRRSVPLSSPRPSKSLRPIHIGPGPALRMLPWALVGLSVLLAIVGIARFWILT